MKRYEGTVRLGGDLRHTVPKTGMSAAEIVVLRYIHGHDAVVDLKPMDHLVQAEAEKNAFAPLPKGYHEEYMRLASIYGPKRMDDIFPGYQKVLPASLEDIQITPEQAGGFVVVSSNTAKNQKAQPSNTVVVEPPQLDENGDHKSVDPALDKILKGGAMYVPPGEDGD